MAKAKPSSRRKRLLRGCAARSRQLIFLCVLFFLSTDVVNYHGFSSKFLFAPTFKNICRLCRDAENRGAARGQSPLVVEDDELRVRAAPLTSTTLHIKNSIQNFSKIYCPWSSKSFWLWQQRFYLLLPILERSNALRVPTAQGCESIKDACLDKDGDGDLQMNGRRLI